VRLHPKTFVSSLSKTQIIKIVQTHIYKKYLSFHNVATLVIYWSNIKVFQKAKCWNVEDKTTEQQVFCNVYSWNSA
jgi:hypothetical protein